MSLTRPLEVLSELETLIEQIGFLPLFKNVIPGFSVEEITIASHWFDGHEHDPWQWSRQIAQKRQIVYGKFFRKRAGFISKQWLPFFANARRDGYDFDALCDDGKSPHEHKRVMSPFVSNPGLIIPSHVLKSRTGFAQQGIGGFDSILMNLQMQTYLCICGFEKKRNRRNEPYGWPVAVYAMPESIFSAQWVQSRYEENPVDSMDAIVRHAKTLLPEQDTSVWSRFLR